MRKVVLSSFLFLFALTAISYAGHHWYKWWDCEKTVEKLNITDAQMEQIKKINESYEEKITNLHTDLKTSSEGYHAAMNNPKATDEEIKSKYEDKLTKKHELKKVALEKKLKIRKVLNDDQIVALGEIKKSKWEKKSSGCDKEGKECGSKKYECSEKSKECGSEAKKDYSKESGQCGEGKKCGCGKK